MEGIHAKVWLTGDLAPRHDSVRLYFFVDRCSGCAPPDCKPLRAYLRFRLLVGDRPRQVQASQLPTVLGLRW